MNSQNKPKARWWHLGVLCLTFALLAIGCGGSGGSNAAPTGGGDSPVTVEIPALGEVSGLPFMSGVVVGGSSSLSAPFKSMSSLSGYKTVGVSGNPYTAGMSIVSCETTNSFRVLLDASTRDDQNICMIQDMADQLSTDGIDLYDGEYHIVAMTVSFPGLADKYKVKVTRNSSDTITGFELFTCASNSQTGYNLHTISGSNVTIGAKDVTSTFQAALSLTGVLATDPTQYESKSVSYTYSGTNDSGAYSGIGDMTQAEGTVLVNTYDTRESYTRVNSSTDLTNPTTTPFDPREYALGSGAGIWSTVGGTTIECWPGTTLFPIECLSSNSNFAAMNDETTRAIVTVTTPSFGTSETWNCSGTVEATITRTEGDFNDADSCFSRFTIAAEHINCATSTAGAYYVSGALSGDGGASLSTSQSAPTSVSTAPYISLGTPLASNTSTFNSSTVTLTDVLTGSSVTLAYDNWSGDSMHFTINPALTSGREYKLTVVGGSSGVQSGTGLTMATTQIYYISAQ